MRISRWNFVISVLQETKRIWIKVRCNSAEHRSTWHKSCSLRKVMTDLLIFSHLVPYCMKFTLGKFLIMDWIRRTLRKRFSKIQLSQAKQISGKKCLMLWTTVEAATPHKDRKLWNCWTWAFGDFNSVDDSLSIFILRKVNYLFKMVWVTKNIKRINFPHLSFNFWVLVLESLSTCNPCQEWPWFLTVLFWFSRRSDRWLGRDHESYSWLFWSGVQCIWHNRHLMIENWELLYFLFS